LYRRYSTRAGKMRSILRDLQANLRLADNSNPAEFNKINYRTSPLFLFHFHTIFFVLSSDKYNMGTCQWIFKVLPFLIFSTNFRPKFRMPICRPFGVLVVRGSRIRNPHTACVLLSYRKKAPGVLRSRPKAQKWHGLRRNAGGESQPAWMPASTISWVLLCKPKAQNCHGGQFWAAQGIGAEIPEAPRPLFAREACGWTNAAGRAPVYAAVWKKAARR
jgi:hypothetical protein